MKLQFLKVKIDFSKLIGRKSYAISNFEMKPIDLQLAPNNLYEERKSPLMAVSLASAFFILTPLYDNLLNFPLA